jgi:hypothetical protein
MGLQVLSSIMLDPVTFAQRIAITSQSGEEAVLTFKLTVEEEVSGLNVHSLVH